MPVLCITCDSRVEPSLAKPGVIWCPGCEKEIKKVDTYKVGKRFFSKGIGAMLAAVAALSATGFPTELQTKPEATNTFMAMKRQKRRKLKGLKVQQRRHMRQKGGKR